jgi:hypothetical protein
MSVGFNSSFAKMPEADDWKRCSNSPALACSDKQTKSYLRRRCPVESKPEVTLNSIRKQDVVFCPKCAVLILKHVRKVSKPLFFAHGIYCPICDQIIVREEDLLNG